MSLRTREDIWHEAVADPKFRRIMIEAEEKLRRNPRVVDLHCSGRETLEVTGILINLVETDGEIRHYGTLEHTNRVSWLSPICDSISDYGYCSRNGFERRESPKPDSFFEIISIDDLETLCLSTAAQGNMIDTDSYYENCHLNLVGLERLFGGEVHVSRFYLNGKTRDYAAYFPLDMFLTQMQDVKVEADI